MPSLTRVPAHFQHLDFDIFADQETLAGAPPHYEHDASFLSRDQRMPVGIAGLR